MAGVLQTMPSEILTAKDGAKDPLEAKFDGEHDGGLHSASKSRVCIDFNALLRDAVTSGAVWRG